MIGLTLDAGALIALERGDRQVTGLLRLTFIGRLPIAIPAGVLAQVWRDGARQARLAHLLNQDIVEVIALDDLVARCAGMLCGRAGTADIVDASVVACALERRHTIATSDPDDLRRLDGRVELIVV